MKRWLAAILAALVAVALAATLAITTVTTVLSSGTTRPASQSTDLTATQCVPQADTGTAELVAGPDRIANLTAEQTGNARTIVQTGQALGIPTKGLIVAVATAMQESSLRNVRHGDRAGPDSTGLFQQRDPWGPREVREDPAGATTLFFQGGRAAGTPGLTGIRGWEAMPIWEAAQRVQRSAFPRAYAKHEAVATAAVAAFAASGPAIPAPVCVPPEPVAAAAPGGVPAEGCRPSGLGAERGLTRDALQVMRCTAQLTPTRYGMGGNGPRPIKSDHGTGRAVDIMASPGGQMPDATQKAYGDQVAAFYQQNAEAFGVTYLIWGKRIWSVARADEGWRPYTHPDGNSGVTLDHYDHVHVSVKGDAGTVPSQ